MRRAVDHLRKYLANPPQWRERESLRSTGDDLETPAWIEQNVLTHAQLLAGDWDTVHRQAKANVLGWSGPDNPQAVAVPVFLAYLSGRHLNDLTPNLGKLWQWMVEKERGLVFDAEEGLAKGTQLHQALTAAYETLFKEMAIAEASKQELLTWCTAIARARAVAIVENQHRRSYDRAAMVITAVAEVLQAQDRGEDERQLIGELRATYRRHRAFQAELDRALGLRKR